MYLFRLVVYLGDDNGSVMAEMAAYFVDDDGDSYMNDGSGLRLLPVRG
jgi:hypothetical protein